MDNGEVYAHEIQEAVNIGKRLANLSFTTWHTVRLRIAYRLRGQEASLHTGLYAMLWGDYQTRPVVDWIRIELEDNRYPLLRSAFRYATTFVH